MINCLIVDDEPLALELMEDNISKVPFLAMKGKAKNPMEAMELMKHEQIDLLFLDIQMPGITGIQFLKSLTNPPMVIFVTAYEKHALEGFELNVVDYLVKPVALDRFLKAVNKANDLFQLKQQAAKGNSVSADYFFVHAEYNLIKIPVNDVRYIEGLKDYVKIFLSTQSKPVLTRMNLKQMEEKLDASKFFRIHKSYIVSLNKIKSVNKTRVLIDEDEIPVGDNFRQAFMQVIGLDHPSD